MRATRTTTSILAISLLVVSTIGVAAQDEEAPPPSLQGRVEVPEHGYAITFPDGWVVAALDQVVAERLTRAAMDLVLDPEAIAMSESIGFSSVVSIEAISLGTPPTDGQCHIQVKAQQATVTEPLVAYFVESFAEAFGDSAVDGPHGQIVSLPAGNVARFDMDLMVLGESGAVRVTQYMFADGEYAWSLICSSMERPADGWLSIAETFEFLPAEG